MVKYLISACLVGENVRYNGGNCLQEKLKYLIESHQAISFCPEVAGGLSTPRLPAEIVGGQAQDVFNQQAVVLDSSGQDVTQAFINGAYQTFENGTTESYQPCHSKSRQSILWFKTDL